jgi:hypothetical protein
MPIRIGGGRKRRNWIASVRLGDPFLPKSNAGGPFSQAPGVATETDTALALRQRAPLPALLTQGSSTTNTTSYATASVSVTLGRPVVIDVFNDSSASGNDQPPTGITGPGGMTFTKVAETNPDVDFVWQSRWVAVPTSTASGAITITYSTTQDYVVWAVTEWTGTPATGTGTNMFSEHVTGNVASGAGTTDTEALASIGAQNRPFAAFAAENTAATVRTATADAGWSELSDTGVGDGGFSYALTTIWRDSNDDLSAGVTWTAGTGVKSAIISEVVYGSASLGGAVGLATETDTARQLVMQKMRAAETDTALALARRKLRATGLATETDTALALGRVKARSVGLATETDTALALGRVKLRAVGLASETDTAFALARGGLTLPTGLASETDAAFALARIKSKAVAIAAETDAAIALARVKARATGRADEIDTALALARGGVVQIATGLASETDTAFALGSIGGASAVAVTPAGGVRRRKRERFIARFRGEDREFETLEALEAFVSEATASQQPRPVKAREPIRIEIAAPALQEAADAGLALPRRLAAMPTGAALAAVRKFDAAYTRMLRDVERARQREDEDEEVMLWLM